MRGLARGAAGLADEEAAGAAPVGRASADEVPAGERVAGVSPADEDMPGEPPADEAPDRYGHAFQIRIMVCDGEGNMLADVWSAPAEDRPRPDTAGRTGISHTHSADFDTDEDFPPVPNHPD